MHDRLRPLWDFIDLDGSERRFRAQLELEQSDEGRAEVLTQIARAEALRGAYAEADRLLDEAEALPATPLAATRVALERGRVRRSSGDPGAALPLFQRAYELAVENELLYLGGDAAHMAALAAPDRPTFQLWTERGLELAEHHEEAAYWAGPLLNNIGWDYFDAGEHVSALDAFERALAVRERGSDEEAVQHARYAVAKALLALGRADEAIAHLEPAVAWGESRRTPDGWCHEALAESYAAVGRQTEAMEHAKQALPLLVDADPTFATDALRVSRLRLLACETGG